MRRREILLLGGGLTGAFFLGLGMLTMPVPAEPAASTSPRHQPEASQAAAFGWIPAATPEPLGEPTDEGEAASPSVVGGPGEAGIWSLPAEFADPE
jgi:hypothetical protein